MPVAARPVPSDAGRPGEERSVGGGGGAAEPPDGHRRPARGGGWRWGDPARDHPSIPVLWRAAVAYVAIVAGLAALAALVTWSEGGDGWITAPDRELEAALGTPRHELLESMIGPLTGLTDPFTVLAVAASALPLLAIGRWWRQLSVLIVAVLLELACFLTVSLAFDRPRPASAPESAPFTGSFPSGHAAMAVALWGGLAVVVASLAGRRWVGRLAAGLAVLAALGAGAARVVLGYHHLSDVVVGWTLGAVCLVVAVRVSAHLGATSGPRRHDPGDGWAAGSAVAPRR